MIVTFFIFISVQSEVQAQPRGEYNNQNSDANYDPVILFQTKETELILLFSAPAFIFIKHFLSFNCYTGFLW